MEQDRLVTADDLIRGGCCRSGVSKALLREYERGRVAAAMPAYAVAALARSTERDMVKQALHIDGFGDGYGDSYGDGYGYGEGVGYGYGEGVGYGYSDSYGDGYGDGSGSGYGDGSGSGSGYSDGDGYGCRYSEGHDH